MTKRVLTKRALSIIFMLSFVFLFLTALSACSVTSPLKDGAAVEESIQTDKEYTIGNLSKTGWCLNITENTFDEETALTMKVLSEEESMTLVTDAFEFVGTAVQISAGNEGSVRLNSPVTVTMQIPEAAGITKETVDDYLVGYNTGDTWVYIFPEVTELVEGKATFDTYHFSPFATVKLTEAEKIKLYSQKMALQQWETEEQEKALSDKVQSMFNEAFEKMGISDSTMQGKLFRSIAKERDFGSLLVSTERGDLADFGVKCGEMAANALIKHLSLEDALMENLTKKGAAVATGLSKAAIQVYDGNYTEAAKELSSAFIGYFPAGRAFQATAEIIDAGISTWKDYELDAAYKSYVGATNNGAYGYKVDQGDWATLCIQMRGYLTRLQDEAKNTYCAVNQMSRSTLDQDKNLSDQIAESTVTNLKKQFENRLANEQNIKVKEAEYADIIDGFKKSLLLERGTFGFDFGMDMEDRLRTLFSARQNILTMFGDKMPILKSGESAEANLNEAIAKWISLGPKKRGEFYKWLEEKGYKSKSEKPGGDFAWVLAKTNNYDGKVNTDLTNENGVYKTSGSAADGSYSYVWTYLGDGDTYYDPDLLAGENSTSKCTFTVPPSTIKGGEVITLTLKLSFGSQKLSYFTDKASASADFEQWDVEPGYATGSGIPFVNKDGKSSFNIDTYKTINVLLVSDTITATAPAGAKAGERIALRTLFNGVKMGTCYIYEWKEIG